jgi:hypothetical protein
VPFCFVLLQGFAVTNFFEYSSNYFIESNHNHVSERSYYSGAPGFNINGFYNASADFTGALVVASVWRGNTVSDGGCSPGR